LPPVAQRLRDAGERFAKDPSTAATYAGDIEGWLQLTGYAGDAAARLGRSDRAADALTEAGIRSAPRRSLAARICSTDVSDESVHLDVRPTLPVNAARLLDGVSYRRSGDPRPLSCDLGGASPT